MFAVGEGELGRGRGKSKGLLFAILSLIQLLKQRTYTTLRKINTCEKKKIKCHSRASKSSLLEYLVCH